MTSEILAAIWDGDPDAFRALVESQTSRLYGIAFKITRDSGLSHDIVQETFLRVLDSQARLRNPAAGEAWLGRIAGRLALDAVRRRGARQRLKEQVLKMPEPVQPDPADEAIRSEQIRLVGEALGLLEAETRTVLVLHVVERNSVREIAEALGTSKSRVLRRIQAGMKALERHLKRFGLAAALMAPVGDLLRAVPGPEPPVRVYASCRALAERVRPELTPAAGGYGPSPRRLLRAAPVAASAIVLVGLLVWFWNSDRRGPRPEEPRPGIASSPVRPPTPGPQEAPPPPAGEAAEARQVDRPEGAVSGRVLRPDGSPAGGAVVKVYRDFTRTDIAALVRDWTFVDVLEKACEPPVAIAEGPSDEEGRFSMEIPVPAGEPLIIVALSPPLEAEWSGGLTRLAGQETTDVEIQLAFALTIAGSVKDPDGASLAGCTVVAVPWPDVRDGTDLTTHDVEEALGTYEPSAATTDTAGGFKLHGLPQLRHCQYALIVRRAGFCSSFLTVPYGPDITGVEVVLEPSRRVRGRVFFTPGDEPAAQARVVAMPLETREPRWFATAGPDARGEFVLNVSTRIEWKALAKTPGQIFPRRVIVPPGEDVADLTMDIARGGTSLRGTVRFAESGLAAAGVTLLCRDWAGAILSAETTTDGEGRYEFQGLSWSSRAQVIPKLPGRTRRDWTPRLPTQREPHVVLDIDLVPSATLRGIVEGPGGRPVEGVLVEVFSVVGSTLEAAGLRWRREALGQRPCLTDGAGAFVIEDYPPHDKVYLWAHEPELGEAIIGPLDVTAASGAEALKISLSGGAVLELLLVDPAGRPLEGFHVHVASQEFPGLIPDAASEVWYAQRTSLDLKRTKLLTRAQPAARNGVTEADGRIRLAGLIPGVHSVEVSGPTIDKKSSDSFWLFSSVTESAIAAGEPASLRVALDVGHRLEGTLARSGGEPLARHRVYAHSAEPMVHGLKRSSLRGVAVTDEDGRFVIPDLGPGPYRVTVLDPGRTVAVIFERHVPETGNPVTLIAPETPERMEPISKKRGE
jgi:RNA polymerase sigma-70 factor (ECF subfamily)